MPVENKLASFCEAKTVFQTGIMIRCVACVAPPRTRWQNLKQRVRALRHSTLLTQATFAPQILFD